MKHEAVKKMVREFMASIGWGPLTPYNRQRWGIPSGGLYADDLYLRGQHIGDKSNLMLAEYKPSPTTLREVATGVGQLLLVSSQVGITNRLLVIGEPEFCQLRGILSSVVTLFIYNEDSIVGVAGDGRNIKEVFRQVLEKYCLGFFDLAWETSLETEALCHFLGYSITWISLPPFFPTFVRFEKGFHSPRLLPWPLEVHRDTELGA